MNRHVFRYFIMVGCLVTLIGLFSVVSAQDTATPAPGMDMGGMDMSGHSDMDMSAAPMAGAGDITIHFAARVGDKNFACGIVYDGLGSDNSTIQVSDFRLYVSNIRLIDADQNEVPLVLDQDGLWQFQDVALLDFEDGTGPCGDGGNEQLRTIVTGTAPEGTYTGIVFDLGVPAALDHLDISTAASPLNLDAMWWSWQTGFKFLRIDMTAGGNPYLIHLGSTGCVSANDTTAPEQPCANPNRPEIRMDGFDLSRNFVVADLATLVNGVTLTTSTPRPPGCMSGPDDPDCGGIFANLGLSLTAGGDLQDHPQQLFRMG